MSSMMRIAKDVIALSAEMFLDGRKLIASPAQYTLAASPMYFAFVYVTMNCQLRATRPEMATCPNPSSTPSTQSPTPSRSPVLLKHRFAKSASRASLCLVNSAGSLSKLGRSLESKDPMYARALGVLRFGKDASEGSGTASCTVLEEALLEDPAAARATVS